MSINKNFVVKNGFEVSDDLILANATTRRVGVGTTNAQHTLDVRGGIGATNFYATGIGTFVEELNVGPGGTVLKVSNSVGIGTSLPAYLVDIRSPVSTGQTALYVQGDVRVTGDLQADDITFDDAEIQDLTVTDTFVVVGLSTFSSNVFVNAELNVSGFSTFNNSVQISNDLDVTGISTLSNVDINAGEIDVTRIETQNLNVTGISTLGVVEINSGIISATSGIVTYYGDGSNLTGITTAGGDIILGFTTITELNVTDNLFVSGISTFGNIVLDPVGIITAVSGIVTYYGDGTYLDLSNNPTAGIGIGTTGGVVGYGITFIDFYGAGVSTAFYDSNVGIATIFFEGGGSGSIGIGTEFPVSATNGDLFFSAEFGRLFVYYDEVVIGVGLSAFWVDASPFSVGIISAVSYISVDPNTASSPAISFTGDLQTGFFSPGLGEFTIVSAGSSILNVNASGVNVTGIITASSFSGNLANTLTLNTSGTGLSGSTTFNNSGAATFTVTSNATSNNINSTIVARNAAGGFNAGIITASAFFGDGSGLTGVGSTVNDDTITNQDFYPIFTQITSGIVTATKVSTTKLSFNPSTGTLTVIDLNSTSDRNLKTNIKTVENALETVNNLRGVSFDWKDNGKSSYGVIAQEMEEVLPELVKDGDVKSVNYHGLIGVLIEAIKELKIEIEHLKKY